MTSAQTLQPLRGGLPFFEIAWLKPASAGDAYHMQRDAKNLQHESAEEEEEKNEQYRIERSANGYSITRGIVFVMCEGEEDRQNFQRIDDCQQRCKGAEEDRRVLLNKDQYIRQCDFNVAIVVFSPFDELFAS
jgi:hypothetical protein